MRFQSYIVRISLDDVDVTCEAGSYLRLIDAGITQLKAQGPSRTCNEGKEEEEAFLLGSKERLCIQYPSGAPEQVEGYLNHKNHPPHRTLQ